MTTTPPAAECRICGSALHRVFVDLGSAPPCEALIRPEHAGLGETTYPLAVYTCEECLLVQLPEHLRPEEIFTDSYAYYSSYSSSWVEHARRYAEMARERFALDADSRVVEVASNDGYLLQHFAAAGVPVLGVEPTANTAAAARERGVPTEEVFLGAATGRALAERHGRADLVVGNNVLAHVPDLRDFVAGLAALLSPTGTLTLEFPHLLRLIEQRQYDTIYHEHFSYFSLLTAQRALATSDLVVIDVEELASHGGSLRLYVQHADAGGEPDISVTALLELEAAAGLHALEGHDGFSDAVLAVKHDLLQFLLTARREGRTVVGYGAPGKGNTLLNHCGIRPDLLAFTVDRNPHKHGTLLPGSRIPVLAPEALDEARPDYVLVLPWNLRREIAAQLEHVRSWGGRLVVAIPELEVLS